MNNFEIEIRELKLGNVYSNFKNMKNLGRNLIDVQDL